MEANELQTICSALDSLFKPDVDNSIRTEAIKLCESYKSDPRCAEIGFYLANSTNVAPNVRYYGLQLIKHRIRMHWTSLTAEEQMAMKSLTLNLVSSCSIDQPNYIKSLLGSIINEVVKHVWPQRWKTMVDEIIASCTSDNGSASLEITLLFFLALAEDVALYQNINTKSRARDLRQALSVGSASIFEFMFQILRKESQMIVASQPTYHNRLVTVALRAVESYVEWINLTVVFMDDGAIFQTLFYLFNFEELRVPAVECLLAIVGRKGHFNDRKLLIKLTDNSFIEKFVPAVKEASQVEGFSESNFQFLFTIGKVLCTLSTMLVGLWEDGDRHTEDCPNEMVSRKNYLEMIFFLSDHESKVVAQSVLQSWIHLIRHSDIRKDGVMVELIPVLIDLASKYLSKKNTFIKSECSPIEAAYLSDSNEMAQYVNLHRSYIIDMLRLCASASPFIALQKCFDYTEAHLAASYNSVEELHIHLNGVVTFIETVVNSAVLAVEENNEVALLPIARAESILNRLFSKNITDVTLMHSYMSCAYGLCKLLVHSSNSVHLFTVLFNHLFSILDETAGVLSSTAVISLRRHVCSIIVRTSRSHSHILVKLAEHLKQLILERLGASPCKLSGFEKVAMFESLILISMQWNDHERQSNLIADIMSTTNSVVEFPGFLEALRSPLEFANSVGLGVVDADPMKDTSAGIRSNIYYYSALIYAVLNRTQRTTKDDCPEVYSPNPCALHMSKPLDHILMLSYLISSMWSPQVRNHIAADNLKTLDIRECEKRHLICQSSELGRTNEGDERQKSHSEKIQVFLVLCLDHCYMALGLIGKTLGPSFYNIPQLQQIILQKIFVNVEFLPCTRHKSFLRHFLTPFLKFCPVEKIDDVISPLLQSYCMFMMERLRLAWDVYGKREYERLEGVEDINDVEEKEEDEILEEQILRVLTRDHLDLLINIINNKNPPSHKNSDEKSENVMSEDVDMKPAENSHGDQLTTLGAAIAASPCCEQVMQCALRALTWYDTTSCQKAIFLLCPLLRQLVNHQISIFNDQFTRHVLHSLLCGLARHGQHDGCEAPICSLFLMMIRSLKQVQGSVIAEVLLSTQPEDDKNDAGNFLEQFDSFSEKKRKTSFRKLIGHVIIRHAGQRFKEIPEMNTFAPIIYRKKTKENITEVESFGLAALFRPLP